MMKFGDKVIIQDDSKVDGCVGIVYRLDGETVHVLLDKEVIWPVKRDCVVLEQAPRPTPSP